MATVRRDEVVIIGGGGHGKVVIDAIKCGKNFKIHGIVDPVLRKGASVLGAKVLGSDEILPEIFERGVKYAFIGIGSIGDCNARKRIYNKLRKIRFRLPVIIHSKATAAKDVKIGEGTFVAAGAIINPGTKIGKNTIINTRSSIDHDCIIGDFVHIAPGVTLSGGVKIGHETHIGTGANVIQNINIGRNCTIGVGVAVLHDVADGTKYVGEAGVKKIHERV